MSSVDSFGAKSTLDVDGKSYEIYRLDAVTGEGLDVASLPYSLKVLLENLLRCEDGTLVTMDEHPLRGPARTLHNPAVDALIRIRNVETLRRLESIARRRVQGTLG